MELWINPIGYQHALKLIKNKDLGYLIVGFKKLSTRNSCLITIAQLKKLFSIKTNIAVSLNNLYVDEELETLEKCIKNLKQIGIKTIIFSDYAVKRICDELNYHPYLIYHPETLNTNYGQFLFLKKNGIKEVVLSKELFLKEILEIAKNKKGMHICIKAEGFDLLMHSKWKLLTNYKKELKLKMDVVDKPFYLKEETRNVSNIIIEDETGSHLFTNYNVSIIEYLNQFYKAGIDSIYFNTYLQTEKWVDENIKIYTQAIKIIKQNKFTINKNKFINMVKKNNLPRLTTSGFLDPKKGLLYLKQNNDNE